MHTSFPHHTTPRYTALKSYLKVAPPREGLSRCTRVGKGTRRLHQNKTPPAVSSTTTSGSREKLSRRVSLYCPSTTPAFPNKTAPTIRTPQRLHPRKSMHALLRFFCFSQSTMMTRRKQEPRQGHKTKTREKQKGKDRNVPTTPDDPISFTRLHRKEQRRKEKTPTIKSRKLGRAAVEKHVSHLHPTPEIKAQLLAARSSSKRSSPSATPRPVPSPSRPPSQRLNSRARLSARQSRREGVIQQQTYLPLPPALVKNDTICIKKTISGSLFSIQFSPLFLLHPPSFPLRAPNCRPSEAKKMLKTTAAS